MSRPNLASRCITDSAWMALTASLEPARTRSAPCLSASVEVASSGVHPPSGVPTELTRTLTHRTLARSAFRRGEELSGGATKANKASSSLAIRNAR